MSEEEDSQPTFKPSSLSGESEASVDKSDSQTYSEDLLGGEFINRATDVAKERVYVEDEDDAPEGYEVEQGPGGVYFYETGSTDNGRNGASVPDEEKEEGAPRSSTVDNESMWQAEFTRNYDEGDEVTIDTEEEGKFRGEIVRFDSEDKEVVLNTEGRGHDSIPLRDIESCDLKEAAESDEEEEEDMTEKEYIKNLFGEKFKESAEVIKDRRYVEDPSDAPEGVNVEQGPQGGYYYETGSSGDDSDVDDNTPDTADGETLWEAELATNYEEGDEVVVDTERVGEIEGRIPQGGLDFLEYDELIIEDGDGNEHSIPTGDIQGLEEKGESKGADPKDPDMREAAEYLAQELGGDVEPEDVLDAVQTHRRVQPDDE